MSHGLEPDLYLLIWLFAGLHRNGIVLRRSPRRWLGMPGVEVTSAPAPLVSLSCPPPSCAVVVGGAAVGTGVFEG